jgi:hypothetical protein
VLLLLHCQIPHISRVPAVRQRSLLLAGGRQQPEPRHNRRINANTDNCAYCAHTTVGAEAPA